MKIRITWKTSKIFSTYSSVQVSNGFQHLQAQENESFIVIIIRGKKISNTKETNTAEGNQKAENPLSKCTDTQ